ncbi:ABC transporter permease [Spongiivirga sp. MCCC 1A20706]|uniref:ABC transporter permease n=1 Tax=Spongiivirga sp. MCCC 1A20706 TaxID=3160963 RepID=UPI003977A62B
MIKNYLKIAWRNLLKNKIFSFINILSLSIGLSAAFVIGLIIYHDMTFDNFHKDADRIYRITSDFTSPQGKFHNTGVPVPLTKAVGKEVSGLELVAPFYRAFFFKVQTDHQPNEFKDVSTAIFTDHNYFQLFNYQWLTGNPANAFKNPNQVVLTKEKADKYFPGLTPEQAMGLNVTYNDSIVAEVAGIVNSFEGRSDLFFDEFISRSSATSFGVKDQVDNIEWNNTTDDSQLFVKVSKGVAIENIQSQLDRLAEQHKDPDDIKYGQTHTYYAQPLSDIHFNSTYGIYDYSLPQASKKTLIGLAIVSIFLLLLGCVNFINLNTAQGLKRSKEVGVRKTLGGSKKQIRTQFLTETGILTMFAAVLSVFVAFWLLQVFRDFIPATVTMSLFYNPIVIVGVLLLLVIVSVVSGFYPALVLSKFKPAKALKDQVASPGETVPLRKYLTVFQFVIAQVFVIGTLLVGKQIHYMMNEDMGIKTEAVAYVNFPFNDKSFVKKQRVLDKISRLPQVEKSAFGGRPPASFGYNATTMSYVTDEKNMNAGIQLLFGDEDYAEVYDIKLLAGRKALNDTIRELVINEKLMKTLGFNDAASVIGEQLQSDDEKLTIVGVMKDFNQRSLKSGIEPMALIGDWYRDSGFSQFNYVHFSLPIENKEAWQSSITEIETIWKDVYPETEFRLTFMDNLVQQFYNQERKMALLLKWATGLSILISCLGLLGLVIYTTERRTKEIGIRKVLGASLLQLNMLLCKEFLWLVSIAFLIAIPIAWYGIDYWLQDFTYKASIGWGAFAVSGIGMIVLALAIMSFKTIAAGMRNPVESLRTE